MVAARSRPAPQVDVVQSYQLPVEGKPKAVDWMIERIWAGVRVLSADRSRARCRIPER